MQNTITHLDSVERYFENSLKQVSTDVKRSKDELKSLINEMKIRLIQI